MIDAVQASHAFSGCHVRQRGTQPDFTMPHGSDCPGCEYPDQAFERRIRERVERLSQALNGGYVKQEGL